MAGNCQIKMQIPYSTNFPQETVKFDNDSEMTFCIEFNTKYEKKKEKYQILTLFISSLDIGEAG